MLSHTHTSIRVRSVVAILSACIWLLHVGQFKRPPYFQVLSFGYDWVIAKTAARECHPHYTVICSICSQEKQQSYCFNHTSKSRRQNLKWDRLDEDKQVEIKSRQNGDEEREAKGAQLAQHPVSHYGPPAGATGKPTGGRERHPSVPSLLTCKQYWKNKSIAAKKTMWVVFYPSCKGALHKIDATTKKPLL